MGKINKTGTNIGGRGLSGSALVVLAIVASPAMAAQGTGHPEIAQQSGIGGAGQDVAAASTEAGSAEGLQDIVVTANRRAESQQQVPIVISAFSSEELLTVNIQNTTDLTLVTPGLSFQRQYAGANAFLRGVGTVSGGYTTEPPIATYLDGLYLPNAAAASFAFNNIERVEVLKGPQGTLYGRNSTGGLIHVITREPDARPSVDASVTYGNYDTVALNFYGSTPITDTLSANFAATYTHQGDGWGRNVFLNEEAYKFKDLGFQAKIRWQPSADTTITLRGFYDRVVSDQAGGLAIYPGSVGTDGTRYLGEYRFSARSSPYLMQRAYAISLKAEQNLDFATLTSITGYVDNDSFTSLATNGIPGNTSSAAASAQLLDAPLRTKTFSQELTLASNESGAPLQWIAGAFYFHDNPTIEVDIFNTCIGTTCAPGRPPFRLTSYPKTRSYSLYGEGTYSILEGTRLTVGLRYTTDRKTLTGMVIPLPGRPNSVTSLPGFVLRPGDPYTGNPDGIDTKVRFNKVTWKLVLAQDLAPDVHGYISYNRGFKSGGYNPISFTNPPSEPEVLDAYEIGVKSELFDRKLRLNVAGFYYEYRDIQLRSSAPPALPGTPILYNAASAHIKGVDVDFDIVPFRGLSISGGLEYLDGTYQDFPGGVITSANPAGGTIGSFGNLAGNRVPSAPKFSYTLGARYEFDTAVGQFAIAVTDGYKSSYFWEPDNRLRQDSYHLVNGSITWTEPSERFSIQLFAKNIGGEYYYSFSQVSNNDVYIPAAPRTYGVTARYKF